jgi:sigma-E factor negative regulatory protein RseB
VRLDRASPTVSSRASSPPRPSTITASYDVALGGTERVLNYECQWIKLDPRDELRFAQRVCAEIATGLILRAKVLNLQKQVIEQYTFTELRVGAARSDLRRSSRRAAASGRSTAAARRDRQRRYRMDAHALPPGFRKVAR